MCSVMIERRKFYFFFINKIIISFPEKTHIFFRNVNVVRKKIEKLICLWSSVVVAWFGISIDQDTLYKHMKFYLRMNECNKHCLEKNFQY